MRIQFSLIALAAIVATSSAAMAAKPPVPKISKAQAQAIALKLAPGKITRRRI